MHISLASVLLAVASAAASAAPSVYPTGTTIYHPDKTWNGYTVFDTPDSSGAVLIDMNGSEVRRWTQINAGPGPVKVLPGGFAMGARGLRLPFLEARELVEVDWNGNVVWQFDHTERIATRDGATVWSARQHHDWQREGNPVGYYAPGAEPLVDAGPTLILAHKTVTNPEISDKPLDDDYLVEVAWDGEVLWEWLASDHVDGLGFSSDARKVIYGAPGWTEVRQSFEWLHMNSASYVGPNRWYDNGDARFDPDNVIISSRDASVVAIVDRSGEIVWRVGPDYRETAEMQAIGQIIGQLVIT